MSRQLWLLSFLVVCAWRGIGAQSAPTRGSEKAATTLPFIYDGHIFLAMKIDGADASLVFDPINGILLDRGFVRRAGLPHADWRALGMNGRTLAGGAGGVEHEVTWSPNTMVALAADTFRFDLTPVIPLDSMMTGAFKRRPDGLFGTDLLSKHALRFDFGSHQLSILPTGVTASPGATALPIETLNGKPVVRATITLPSGVTHQLRMLVDFGMAGGVRLTTHLVDSLNLVSLLGATSEKSGERGLGGALSSRAAQLASLQLGAIMLRDYPVSLARETGGADAHPAWDGLIGLELLSRYTMTYDPTQQRLILQTGSGATG